MTLQDKFPHLADPAFLQRRLTRTVYGTMALEEQTVSVGRVAEIVVAVAHEYGITLPLTAAQAAAESGFVID